MTQQAVQELKEEHWQLDRKIKSIFEVIEKSTKEIEKFELENELCKKEQNWLKETNEQHSLQNNILKLDIKKL